MNTNENEIQNEIINNNQSLEELTVEQKREILIKQKIDFIKEKAIQLVLGQTEYTRDEAIEKLNENDFDPVKVIKIFMGINSELIKEQKLKENNAKSKNQKRYQIIREYMDEAANKFYARQEQAKAYEKYMEKKKQYYENMNKQNSNSMDTPD